MYNLVATRILHIEESKYYQTQFIFSKLSYFNIRYLVILGLAVACYSFHTNLNIFYRTLNDNVFGWIQPSLRPWDFGDIGKLPFHHGRIQKLKCDDLVSIGSYIDDIKACRQQHPNRWTVDWGGPKGGQTVSADMKWLFFVQIVSDDYNLQSKVVGWTVQDEGRLRWKCSEQ